MQLIRGATLIDGTGAFSRRDSEVLMAETRIEAAGTRGTLGTGPDVDPVSCRVQHHDRRGVGRRAHVRSERAYRIDRVRFRYAAEYAADAGPAQERPAREIG
jgi:hypothetical protein